MENIAWSLNEEGILKLEVDTRRELGLSSSGKSILIAKGQGPILREHPPGIIRVNVNISRPPTEREKREGWMPPVS